VWLEGADWGTFANVASDRYAKGLPLDAALAPDVLLAWALNGEPLSAEHGFPLRVVVPGCFGTNSIKWLTRVRVAVGRLDGFFTARLYNREVLVDGRPVRQPVRELDVHSVIVRPGEGDALAAALQPVTGWAWSVHEVTRVEVSVDGGTSWSPARVEPRSAPRAWQRFAVEWAAPAGRQVLACRATDHAGRTQPATGRDRIFTAAVTVQ
jgi:DMSO/TMAO reductase YedYZ molybdopterin-dependent catalytic subunit